MGKKLKCRGTTLEMVLKGPLPQEYNQWVIH